jgi:hypothetical protein
MWPRRVAVVGAGTAVGATVAVAGGADCARATPTLARTNAKAARKWVKQCNFEYTIPSLVFTNVT